MADDFTSIALVRSATVATSNGPVCGYEEDRLSVFKGLRYGVSPTGSLRFKPPQRPVAWASPADATSYGAPAIQSGMAPGERGSSAGDPPAPGEPASSEDCLFLNVWTPGLDRAKRPVMVWLHGGGFANGSGGAAMYDGGNLARKGDVVTVSINHRLNVFGYLHLEEAFGADYAQSGIAGMLDIVLALEWVAGNIANFGGDPSNVTIYGESGGGWKVSLLMAMPGATGLFHKAIIQSGPGLRGARKEDSAKTAKSLLDLLGIKDAGGLNALSSETISRASIKVPGETMRLYTPVVDGDALPRDPFVPDAPSISANVPVMIGTNKDESTLFMIGDPKFGELTEEDLAKRSKAVAGDKAEALVAELRKVYPDYSPTYLTSAAQTATGMWLGSITIAERKVEQAVAPAYMYMLTWETPVSRGRLKCPHALEIPLVFDNVERARNFVGRGDEPQMVADTMSSAWLAFAKTGNPGWPAYDKQARATMMFNVDSKVVSDPNPGVRVVLQG